MLPGYADNFSFSVSASAGSGATGGITLSFGGSRLDFPFELSQAAKLKVIKASDTVMAVSGDDILYAYSLPSYAGACAVGVYSDASSISFSHPDYTVFKDKFSALAASPAGAREIICGNIGIGRRQSDYSRADSGRRRHGKSLFCS